MFPYFLSIGMSKEDYWEGSAWITKAYLEAHKLKNESRNQELWLQGLYIHQAFSVVMANAFAKKGAKAEKYLAKPIELYPNEEKRKEEAISKTKANLDKMLKWWELNGKQ